MPPSAMNGTPVPSSASDDRRDGRDLRHADAGDDARRADRAGADADFDAVGTRIDESFRRFGRRDIAGDKLQVRIGTLDGAHALEHVARMAVRRVDDQDVDAGLDEQRDALVGVHTRANRGADAQRATLVFARQRIVVRFLNVLHGDHAAQLEAVLFVDDEQLLDAVLVQEAEHLVLVGASRTVMSRSFGVMTAETGASHCVSNRRSRCVTMPTRSRRRRPARRKYSSPA